MRIKYSDIYLKYRKVFKLKNYFMANVISLLGYYYMYFLYKIHSRTLVLYANNSGADTTYEGLTLTMNSITQLVKFIILSGIFMLLLLLEYYVKKRFFYNKMFKIHISKYIKAVHAGLFWIGMWFPLTRLLFGIVMFVLFIFSNLYEFFTSFVL